MGGRMLAVHELVRTYFVCRSPKPGNRLRALKSGAQILQGRLDEVTESLIHVFTCFQGPARRFYVTAKPLDYLLGDCSRTALVSPSTHNFTSTTSTNYTPPKPHKPSTNPIPPHHLPSNSNSNNVLHHRQHLLAPNLSPQHPPLHPLDPLPQHRDRIHNSPEPDLQPYQPS